MLNSAQSTEVAVIGAGPYGLAIASHLAAAGVTTRIFGIPMKSWAEHMPKGMFLKSAFDATDISSPGSHSTLIDYCKEIGLEAYDDWHPIPVDVFTNYGLRFQERNVGMLEKTLVTNISPIFGGFRVSLADGEVVAARSVVAASGHMSFCYVPKCLQFSGSEGSELVSHTTAHKDFGRFEGKDVAVVGAGQAALESAVLLHESGANVHLLVRDAMVRWGGAPVESKTLFRRLFKPRTAYGPGWSHVFITEAPNLIRFLPPHLRLALVGGTYGPSGAWWLKDRFGNFIHTSLSTMIESVRDAGGRAALQLVSASGERSSLVVDHVIAGTGFKIDINRLNYLDPGIRDGLHRAGDSGSPQLSSGFESSVPGLHFVGLMSAATFGPLLRFVHGTKFAATSVSRAIAGTKKAAHVNEVQ